jgi:hypothetical protein
MSDNCASSLFQGGSPKPRERRTQTVSTKLTPEEEYELQRASSSEGKTMSEWVRDVLLKSARQNPAVTNCDAIVLTEVIGIQLFLMNVLSPLTRGELMSSEQYEVMIRAVQANKVRTAHELLARRLNSEKE